MIIGLSELRRDPHALLTACTEQANVLARQIHPASSTDLTLGTGLNPPDDLPLVKMVSQHRTTKGEIIIAERLFLTQADGYLPFKITYRYGDHILPYVLPRNLNALGFRLTGHENLFSDPRIECLALESNFSDPHESLGSGVRRVDQLFFGGAMADTLDLLSPDAYTADQGVAGVSRLFASIAKLSETEASDLYWQAAVKRDLLQLPPFTDALLFRTTPTPYAPLGSLSDPRSVLPHASVLARLQHQPQLDLTMPATLAINHPRITALSPEGLRSFADQAMRSRFTDFAITYTSNGRDHTGQWASPIREIHYAIDRFAPCFPNRTPEFGELGQAMALVNLGKSIATVFDYYVNIHRFSNAHLEWVNPEEPFVVTITKSFAEEALLEFKRPATGEVLHAAHLDLARLSLNSWGVALSTCY